MRKILLSAAIGVFCCLLSNAQISSPSFYSSKDAHTISGNTSNFGTQTSIWAGINVSHGSTTFRRSYVYFPITGIPADAVITSAVLKVYQTSGAVTTPSSELYVERVTQSWVETTIASGTEPTVSTAEVCTSSTYASNWRSFDVKTHVQKMVNGTYTNEGWRIRYYNEAQTTANLYGFNSREGVNDPVLEVSYYIPFSITNAAITHCTTTISTDGVITPTIANGSGSNTYQWYNSAGAIAGATSSSISNRTYGWYGLQVTGSQGDVFYYSFIIGVKCQEVTINYNPDQNFVDDARVISTSPNNNYGTLVDFISGKSQPFSVWITQKSLLKFRLWVDPLLTVTQANLQLYGKSHLFANSNASYLKKVTQNWKEDSVTWNSLPTSTATNQVSLAASTSSTQNYLTNNTISFWNDWKASNTTNYGMLLELQSSANLAATMNFHSSDASSSKPAISFKFSYNQVLGGTAAATSSSICSGSTTVVSITGHTTGGTFQWQKSTNGSSYSSISGATSSSYTTLSSTLVNTYYRCIVTKNGCSGTSTAVLVTIKPIPTVSVNDATYCTSPNVTLTATPSIGGGTYLWNNGATTASIVVAPSTTTTYTVVYTLNGCASPQGSGRVDACLSNVTFNDTAEEGTITIDVQAEPLKVGPYRYLISQSPIEELSTVYHTLKDSVFGGLLDSATFFTGNEGDEYFTFNNVKMGKYYVGVFDSEGTRIFDREILLIPTITISNSTGMSISTNRLSTTTSNASAAIDLYLNEQTDAEMTFELTDKSKTQFMGFMNTTSTTPGSIGSYQYGFSVKSSLLYLIENGVEGITSYAINNDSKLMLHKADSLMYYYVDGTLVKTSVLPANICYKAGFGALVSGVAVQVIPWHLSKKKFFIKSKITSYFNCDNQEGGFNFVTNNIWGVSVPFTWTVYKDGVQVGASTGSTSSTVFNFDPTSFGPGVYVIYTESTYLSTNYSCTTTVNIGVETFWVNLLKYINTAPNSYSVERNSVDPNTYSSAKSENRLNADENGWIEFKPVYSNAVISDNHLRLSNLFMSNLSPVFSEIAQIRFIKIGANRYMNWTGPNPGTQLVPLNATIFLQVNTTTIAVLVNTIPVTTFTRPAGVIMLRPHSKKVGAGFDHVITSFNCVTSNQYYILKNEVEESIASVSGSKLKFKYEEDYFDNNGVLNYSIKCLNDDAVPTTITVNKPLHTNWIEIPLGSGGITLINGNTYLLEVIDSKGRKQYLKFKKA